MQRLRLILSIVVVIFAAQATTFAEEELFDTATAAEHFEKGIAHLKAKQLEAAVSELEEAVSIYPDAEGYYYLGYAYYLKGRSGDSESRKNSMENFERAYELNPSFTPTKLKPEETMPAVEAGTKPASQSGAGTEPLSSAETVKETQAQPAERDVVQQPDAPIKATERIKNISNIPAVPN